ncbi:MAG: hypothetical protein HKP16_05705 [Xanthomonadales bacterium]|nr:hypothetical protein [Xanthomonadales bacterium]
MSGAELFFEFLLFPGLLFTAVAGLVTSWVDRKVTAMVQMRVGPPFLQPFYDVRKLLIKETCVPEGGVAGLFLAAPLLGFAGVILASLILWRALMDGSATFVGDLIVMIYLLMLPALAVVLGAFASRNPLASIGGSREVKLMMAYELPLVLALLVPVIRADSIRLGELFAAPAPLASLSGVLALLVGIACLQAKLTRAMMLFTLPLFLAALFLGGWAAAPGWAAKGILLLAWFVLVALTVVLRNTTPRVRTDQAVKFFWGPVTAVALLAVVLALVGW